jgi:hypothetical protein
LSIKKPNNNDNNNNNNNNNERDKQRKNEIQLLNSVTEKQKIKTSIIVFGHKVNLWIPKVVWEKFKELAKLDGLSASKLSEKLALDYIKAHSKGNPQLLLTHYVKAPEEEQQPIRVLCPYCQGALTEGKVYCIKKGMWIPSVSCYSCKFNRLRKHGNES